MKTKTKRRRLEPKDRKRELVDAGLVACDQVGFAALRREDVARVAGCVSGTISLHFTTWGQYKRALMREAIRRGALRVIAEGLALRDPNALKAPEDVKARARSAI